MSTALAYVLPARRSLSPERYRRYLPIVRRTAMRLARKVPSHISAADLTGYAWVGLLEAFGRARPDMSDQEFEAYAIYRIRGAMLDHLRSLDSHTRTSRAISRRVAQATEKLTARFTRAPEEDEIAAELEMSLDQYRSTRSVLEAPGMGRRDLLEGDAELAPDGAELPEASAGRHEIQAAVVKAIATLPERLQQVLELYYPEQRTLREIGEILDVSESRVCQLHTEALHRLRAAMVSE